MKRILFITLTAFLLVNIAYSQTYRYNIISNGQSVGELTATQTIGGGSATQSTEGDAATKPTGGDDATQATSGEQRTINIVSHFNAHFFITVHVKYEMNCKYTDGNLVESSVETFKNEELHSSSKGNKTNGAYKTIEDGDESTHEGEILYSGCMLYFKEPKGITHVFSEIHAIEKPVKEVNTNHFMITDPETGHTNQYFYRDGVLQKMIVGNALLTFTMVLIR